MKIERREFLKAAGAAAAVAATGGMNAFGRTRLPRVAMSASSPASSGLEHIVVVCMENRSFDHFLGWVPGANGRQEGHEYADDGGTMHRTHHLTDWQGCGFNDPDHSYSGARVQYNGGACDGFRKGHNDDYALGFYTGSDLEATSAMVGGYTTFDNWFASLLGPTYPNRLYTHSAQTDRITNSTTSSKMPTIWDRLAAAGVPAAYYFSDLPVLALYGATYVSIARHIETWFTQALSGTLPAYTYLDPFFLGEDQGGSNDDHPHADIRRGQAFLSLVINTLQNSPLWSKSALIITYDEWGGFFDHVRPPQLPDAFTPTSNEEHNTAGFRVPTFLVSPYAPRGIVTNTQHDHSSILKFVEWRFGLAPLTPRDAAANNLADVLDPSAPNMAPAAVPLVVDPGPHICGTDVGMPNLDTFWLELKESKLMRSWTNVA